MYDMRPAGTPVENEFATAFLALNRDELRLLFGTCHDQHFREAHTKLVVYLERALLYREKQIESNLEDACSMQDPFLDQWTPDEMLNAVIGLDRLRMIAQEKSKILEFIRTFDRVLVAHGFARWMAVEDNQGAA